jgi:hypothetical protein
MMKKIVYIYLLLTLCSWGAPFTIQKEREFKHEPYGNLKLLKQGVYTDCELIHDEEGALMGARFEIINSNLDKKITMRIPDEILPLDILLFGDQKCYKPKGSGFPISHERSITGYKKNYKDLPILPKESHSWFIPLPDVKVDLNKGNYKERNFFILLMAYFFYVVHDVDDTEVPEPLEHGKFDFELIENIKLTEHSFSRDIVSAYIKSKTKNSRKAKEELSENNDSSDE